MLAKELQCKRNYHTSLPVKDNARENNGCE